MNTPSWTCDDYGTQNLHPTINGATGHVWIQGRRPYCDRGHWEWGFEGLPVRPDDLPTPSYYYMRKSAAMAEVEDWMARCLGAKSNSRLIQDLDETIAFSAGASAEQDWQWGRGNDTTLEAHVPTPGGNTIQAKIEQITTSTGPVFVFSVENMEYDSSDCFPRSYLDLERAMAEAEEFFPWRLLKIPAEIPTLLQDPDRPVGPALAKALNAKPRRRPSL